MTEPLVQLLQLELLGANPDTYTNSLKWRIRLQSLVTLPQPIIISFVWVGSASMSQYDQILDSFDVGPLEKGVTQCTLQCDAPLVQLVPLNEVLGVTILVVSFQYKSQQFLRVGYYAQVAYFDEALNKYPPAVPQKQSLGRFIAMPQPTVTVKPVK